MPLHPALVLAPALLLAAAAPAAAEPVARPLARCYVSVDEATREPIMVDATGFTFPSQVDVLLDGQRAATLDTGSDGRVTSGVPAPFVPRGERAFTYQLVQQGAAPGAGATAMQTARVTALHVDVTPWRAHPSDRVRFRGSGFIRAGRPVFAHYLFAGRVRATVRLARRPTGPCGHVDARARQIPVRRPHVGRWTVQFDQERRYRTAPRSVYVRLAITVQRAMG